MSNKTNQPEGTMLVEIFGTRGSIAVAAQGFLEFGGNTACVCVTFGDDQLVILDAGTGIRSVNNKLADAKFQIPAKIFLGLSHTHWDHIQGFPYFKPAYDPLYQIEIALSSHGKRVSELQDTLARALNYSYFPVPLEKMGAHFSYHILEDLDYTLDNGAVISAIAHQHPGGACSYRIEYNGHSMVYATDVEHDPGIDLNLVKFCQGADLLIHDAHYTEEELKQKRGWGHSSWVQAIEVARLANVGELLLFHHDPDHDDKFLAELELKSQAQFQHCRMAREGMSIIL